MNFSIITDDLFIGTTPSKEDYNHLRGLGVTLVINMRVERRPHKDPHPTPLKLLWLPTFDFDWSVLSFLMIHNGLATRRLVPIGRDVRGSLCYGFVINSFFKCGNTS